MTTAKPDRTQVLAAHRGLREHAADAPRQESLSDSLVALLRQLVDDTDPACIVDGAGARRYANSAFDRIAEAVTPEDLAPRRADGDVVSLTVGDRLERFTVRSHRLEESDGTALIATVLVPKPDSDWARHALDTAIERLEDMTRLVSDWIWETNRNLVLTFVSPRVNEVLGYHQVELTGRALSDLPTHPNETLNGLYRSGGRVPFRDLEVEIADREGRTRYFLLSGLPVYCRNTGDFLGYRGTAHDVTEVRWREGALRQAKEDAEAASRAKGEFLANMSHELRTPLNAIIGFSEIMGDEMLGPLGNEQYKGYIHDIAESARHLLSMINNILDAAKLESGRMALSEERIDANAMVTSVARLMAPRASRAGLDLVAHTPPGLPPILADETKLKQVLLNLVSNAVKFTGEGGRIDIRAEVAETGEFLFMVSDNGIGIAEDDIPQALAPFGQVDTRISRKFEGTGLGLPLAKSLTELHGGIFKLISQPGVGTTVTLRLPKHRVVRPEH